MSFTSTFSSYFFKSNLLSFFHSKYSNFKMFELYFDFIDGNLSLSSIEVCAYECQMSVTIRSYHFSEHKKNILDFSIQFKQLFLVIMVILQYKQH